MKDEQETRRSYWGQPVMEIRLRTDEKVFVGPTMLMSGDIIRTDNGKGTVALETHPLGCLATFERVEKNEKKRYRIIIGTASLAKMELA